MAVTSIRSLLPTFFLALLGLGLSACAGAPVQEMSNARQAIRAAQDAGAAKYAPQQLSEAQSLLSQAEEALQKQEFRNARANASQARVKAVDALTATRQQIESSPP